MADYTFIKSRTGELVPALSRQNGDAFPLHSAIDPQKEAQRLISTVPQDAGFLVFLGLGGGFAPQEALKNTSALVLTIDFNGDSLKKLFASKDYSPLLNNKRFTLLTDPSFDDVKKFVVERYIPALHGGIKVLPLRARTDHDTGLFESAASAIRQAIEIVSGDYSVQIHFGKRWFTNIIRNLLSLQNTTREKSAFFPDIVNEAAIVAAGPSLGMQIEQLAECKKRGVFIICSDTALGALLHNGIQPCAIVSIDCQHISYYHFIGNNTRGIPLILDIASPPLLPSFSTSPLFFSSWHPLARYISASWKPFIQLDTSGGNVTYACLSLAENLGAKSITLFGADFSYVNARTYARGTYIYPYFEIRQNRFSTLEELHSRFLYRAPFLPLQTTKQSYRETTQLRFYREKLEQKVSMTDAQIFASPGLGAPIRITGKNSSRGAREKKKTHGVFYEGKSVIEFLKQYKNDIAALPAGEMNEKQRQIFTTLLPYAAFLKNRNKELKPSELIEKTRQCCMEEIDKVISPTP